MLTRVILLIALPLLAYAAMLNAPFKTLDDKASIVDNPTLRSAEHLPAIFQQGFFNDKSYYRPLVNFSFFLEYQAFKLNAFFYNLNNLIIHILNAFLVFAVASLLLANSRHGFWVALIFAIHPVHWEAVCNIPGRSILLSAFFVLGSLYAFLRWQVQNKIGWLAVSSVSFLLALLSKESSAVLPGVMALYLLLFKDERLRLKGYRLIPYALVLFFYMAWRHHLGITHVFQTDNLQTYLLGFISFLRALITDLRLLILPLGLHFDRGQAFFTGFALPQVGISLLFWLAVCSALIQWRQKITQMGWFLIGWFLLDMLPVSQLVASVGVQPGMISSAEHFLYLASIPFIIGVSLVVIKCTQDYNLSKPIKGFCGAAFFLFFFLLTVTQAIYARDEFVMLTRSLDYQPYNARLQASLGLLYVFNGKLDKAQEHFKMAVATEPMNTRYRISYGSSLCDQEKWGDCLLQFVAIDNPTGFESLVENQKERAMGHLQGMIDQGESLPARAWFAVGVYKAKQGAMDEAIDTFKRAVAIDVNFASAWMNLASLYEAKQDWVNAKEAYIRTAGSPTATDFEKRFAQENYAKIHSR